MREAPKDGTNKGRDMEAGSFLDSRRASGGKHPFRYAGKDPHGAPPRGQETEEA